MDVRRGFGRKSISDLVNSYPDLFLDHDADVIIEMTIDELINGKVGLFLIFKDLVFPGLIPLIKRYIESLTLDSAISNKLFEYLSFISDRASGKNSTNAKVIRNFVKNHDSYKNDSVVDQTITYDLLVHIDAMNDNEDVL